MILVTLDTYKKRREIMEQAEVLSRKLNNLYIVNPNCVEVFELSGNLDLITLEYNRLSELVYTEQ